MSTSHLHAFEVVFAQDRGYQSWYIVALGQDGYVRGLDARLGRRYGERA
jgi:hypothetical protein